MKPSRFNLSFDLADGKAAVFNTATAGTLAMPRTLAAWLTGEKSGLLASQVLARPELVGELLRAGMLVSDDDDELMTYVYRERRGRFLADAANMVVVVTKGCNLTCYYCIQAAFSRKSGTMTPAIADGIVKYFTSWAGSMPNLPAVSMALYGGEPLLAPEICVRLASGLREWSEARNIRCTIPLVTNGFLLAAPKTAPLLDLISFAHMTLDGDREHHDSVRKDRRGRGSYDRIMEGVSILESHERGVAVRLHVNHLTEEGFLRILDDLVKAGLKNEGKNYIYFNCRTDARQTGEAAMCRNRHGNEASALLDHMAALQLAARSHPLGALFADHGDVNAPPMPQPIACGHATMGALAIDSDGTIMTCCETLEEKDRIGRIDEHGRAFWDAKRFEVLTWRWWPDSECPKCQYLPICMTPCPLDRPPTVAGCNDVRAATRKRIEGAIHVTPPAVVGLPVPGRSR